MGMSSTCLEGDGKKAAARGEPATPDFWWWGGGGAGTDLAEGSVGHRPAFVTSQRGGFPELRVRKLGSYVTLRIVASIQEVNPGLLSLILMVFSQLIVIMAKCDKDFRQISMFF